MTKKLECEIVQDLLPSYIEGLTHEVTTKAVNDHLQDCLVCEEVCETMKEPEQKVTDEESRKLNKFLKKVRMKGLITGIVIVATFWLGWTGYQKLFIDTITLPANQIIIEDLAMRTDGRLQFSIKDKNGLPLNWIVGGGSERDGVFSYKVGRTLLEGPLSIDYGIGEKNIFDVEGFSKIIYEDDQGNELVIWEEGMEIPIVDGQE